MWYIKLKVKSKYVESSKSKFKNRLGYQKYNLSIYSKF